jgi:hypothetical protein
MRTQFSQYERRHEWIAELALGTAAVRIPTTIFCSAIQVRGRVRASGSLSLELNL